MASVAATRRHDLTDVPWAALEPLLPKGKKSGRPPKWSKRLLITQLIRARIVKHSARIVNDLLTAGRYPGPNRTMGGISDQGLADRKGQLREGSQNSNLWG
ncbi:hypothetical protein [Micromonospora sp. LH3U1]|uniref:hypothetical protein n=1 Tax=Micromonospora sp. LH3U1 TaxID=3018339 RepID=UPI002349FE17|nr:hypothetical protein [Micromonospora sp. LH3U1]WCN84850.1 hypothetical protein PCA76_09040 [Micromonospora sp. LH3U1]